MPKWLRVWLITIALAVSPLSYAELITIEPQYEDRYHSLLEELRCLVCQNESLADSPSELAYDLRVEVKEMLEGGSTDEEVLTFMSDRYGDFVLYDPPVKPRTLLLWYGPALLLLIGLGTALVIVNQRKRSATTSELSESEQARLKQVLKKDDKDPSE